MNLSRDLTPIVDRARLITSAFCNTLQAAAAADSWNSQDTRAGISHLSLVLLRHLPHWDVQTGVCICQSKSPFCGAWASSNLLIPRSRPTRYGQRCFVVSRTTLSCNSLPLTVNGPSLIPTVVLCARSADLTKHYTTAPPSQSWL